MPRKAQISREKILETALHMLIRDGYAGISITALAAELGCSTQPISWHFGNMEGLRLALLEAAKAYIHQKLRQPQGDIWMAWFNTGRAYIDIALDEPNLYRFYYMGEGRRCGGQGLDALPLANPDMVQKIANAMQLPESTVEHCMKHTIIHVYGIATLLATGVMQASREEAYQMVSTVGEAFLQNALASKGEPHAQQH